VLTETKQRSISGGGTATWVDAPPAPFTAVQEVVWITGTAIPRISFVLKPQTFTAVFQQSGDWWAAWIEELPGANAQGRTLEEARENLREAAQLMLKEGEVPEEAHEPLAPDAIRESLTVLA
jgi:predicted RNase H-like HicB family nuclease